jgi:hypothetical protein
MEQIPFFLTCLDNMPCLAASTRLSTPLLVTPKGERIHNSADISMVCADIRLRHGLSDGGNA